MENNRGLTLVELLLTLVILAVVMTLIATILVQSFNIFRESTERVSKNRLTQIMIKDLSQNIREGHFFDFRNNNWVFYSGKDADGNLIEDFKIKYNSGKLSIIKNGKEVRSLEDVANFKLKSFALNSESNQIDYYNGDNTELDSFIFEFELKVNLGNNNFIEDVKSVYSRNL